MQSCSPVSAAKWYGKNQGGQGLRVEICEANTTRPSTALIGAAGGRCKKAALWRNPEKAKEPPRGQLLCWAIALIC